MTETQKVVLGLLVVIAFAWWYKFYYEKPEFPDCAKVTQDIMLPSGQAEIQNVDYTQCK